LQRDRLAEHSRLLRRHLVQAPVESFQSRLQLAQLKMANPDSEKRLPAPRVGIESTAKPLGGFLPTAQLLQTYRKVEGRGPVRGLDLEQLPVAVGGLVKLPHLEMDVAQRGVDFTVLLTAAHGPVQFGERLGRLALQVQGYRSSQSMRRAAALGPHHRRTHAGRRHGRVPVLTNHRFPLTHRDSFELLV